MTVCLFISTQVVSVSNTQFPEHTPPPVSNCHSPKYGLPNEDIPHQMVPMLQIPFFFCWKVVPCQEKTVHLKHGMFLGAHTSTEALGPCLGSDLHCDSQEMRANVTEHQAVEELLPSC